LDTHKQRFIYIVTHDKAISIAITQLTFTIIITSMCAIGEIYFRCLAFKRANYNDINLLITHNVETVKLRVLEHKVAICVIFKKNIFLRKGILKNVFLRIFF